jgi:hypothetical protein
VTYKTWKQRVLEGKPAEQTHGEVDRAVGSALYGDSYDPESARWMYDANQGFKAAINARFGYNTNTNQALRYVLNMAGPVYLPAHFIATQIARAKPVLYRHADDLDGREKVDRRDRMYDLFNNPNPRVPFRKLLYQASQQQDLTGEAIWWLPPERSDTGEVSDWEPLEAHVIPTACVSNVIRQWRGNVMDETLVVNSHSLGYSGGNGFGGVYHIPAKHCIRMANAHPYLLNDAFSPLSAIGQWVDVVRGIDQVRVNNQKNDIHQRFAFVLGEDYSEAKEGAIKSFIDRLRKMHGGLENAGKVPVLPPGTTISQMGPRPDEMDWPEQYEQVIRLIMASLNLNPSVTGFIDTNFAALYAAIKQFHWSCLSPRLEDIAAILTQQLIQRVWDQQCFLEFDLPRVDEEDRVLQAATWASSCGLMSVAEARRVANDLGLKLDELPVEEAPWVVDRAWARQVTPDLLHTQGDGKERPPASMGGRNDEGRGSLGGSFIGRSPRHGDSAKALITPDIDSDYLLDRLGTASRNGHTTYLNGKSHG